jgi:hypothetical protein
MDWRPMKMDTVRLMICGAGGNDSKVIFVQLQAEAPLEATTLLLGLAGHFLQASRDRSQKTTHMWRAKRL